MEKSLLSIAVEYNFNRRMEPGPVGPIPVVYKSDVGELCYRPRFYVNMKSDNMENKIRENVR